MWIRIKLFLKRFLPIPARSFNRRMDSLSKELKSLNRKLDNHSEDIADSIKRLSETMQAIADSQVSIQQALKLNNDLYDNLYNENQKQFSSANDQFAEVNQSLSRYLLTQEEQEKLLVELKRLWSDVGRTADEILWSEVFNNAISQNIWMKNQAFAPGRWAAGYPFLYVLYRALNDTSPRCILEMGLGETTHMIAQYVKSQSDIEHSVVEHDKNWISYFQNSYRIPDSTEIVELPWGFTEYKGKQDVRVYEGFRERFSDKKYDLICIDAPLGGDMKHYARIDVLSLIPDSLASSFVIIMDDYNRVPERNTCNDIIDKLKQENILFKTGMYKGQKHTLLICSEDLAFLCSL